MDELRVPGFSICGKFRDGLLVKTFATNEASLIIRGRNGSLIVHNGAKNRLLALFIISNYHCKLYRITFVGDLRILYQSFEPLSWHTITFICDTNVAHMWLYFFTNVEILSYKCDTTKCQTPNIYIQGAGDYQQREKPHSHHIIFEGIATSPSFSFVTICPIDHQIYPHLPQIEIPGTRNKQEYKPLRVPGI